MVETKAPASIRRYVSSIAAMYRAAGALNPAASQRVKLALKRLHREQGRAQRQAAPLGRPLVDRMLAVPVAGPNTTWAEMNKAKQIQTLTICARTRGKTPGRGVQPIRRADLGSG
jgi:hypothetical protein